MFAKLLLLNLSLILYSCGKSEVADSEYDNDNLILHSQDAHYSSNPAGNLIASAIKEVNNLDVVLYPSDFLNPSNFALFRTDDARYANQMSSLYPSDLEKDTFITGRMSGKDIKELIVQRAQRLDRLPFQPAGLQYHIQLKSGLLQFAHFNLERNRPLEDSVFYRVAISEYEYDYRKSFPGYYYAHNLNHSFYHTGRKLSAKESLAQYLIHSPNKYPLKLPRAKLTRTSVKELKELRIYQIQGTSHLSPYLNTKVRTQGIVTAIGRRENSFSGWDLYIQDPTGDGNLATSDAIHVFLNHNSTDLKLGDLVEVEATVYEEFTTTGLSRTSLQQVSDIKVIASNSNLPKAIQLGKDGRKIPSKKISSWRGDLNFKPYLELDDAIDFWESLEGMRVQISNPRVAGFRGGYQSITDRFPKGHLNLYVYPDGDNLPVSKATQVNGILSDPINGDFNSTVIQILKSHLSPAFDHEKVYQVGDLLKGSVQGVLGYEPNIFGEGEWSILIPQAQNSLAPDFIKNRKIVPLSERPKTNFNNYENQITIANYNVENLTASDPEIRFRSIGETIQMTLNCPTIINFVEIQDYNGEDFEGGASAEKTLKKIIEHTQCAKNNYKVVNIDPLNHGEGGVPGGNIRVAMIYDSAKVIFKSNPAPRPNSETIVLDNGSLNYNPGRVFPNDWSFQGSRRSLVVEFEFQGERIFVLGNHFNSKLGDRSPWGSLQPQDFRTEFKRRGMAYAINRFVRILEEQNPNALVAVTGDFNAYINERSLDILKGNELINTMDFIPRNQRYTTNHNGSSQALDYLFINKNFLKKQPKLEVLHINSDYQGRYSDHDPLLVQFTF